MRQARAAYEEILKFQPRSFDALLRLGVIAGQMKDFVTAAELIHEAIAINPKHAQAHCYRGMALQELRQLDAALDSYNRAIAIKPDFAGACSKRGNVLRELKQLDAALASYGQAIALDATSAETYLNQGVTLQDLKRFHEALASYEHALNIRPQYAEAYNNRGNSLKELACLEAALESYEQALKIKPDYAEAYYNRGNALAELRRFDEAVENYDRCISLNGDFAEAYANRGIALQELRQLDAAVASYSRALALKADYAEAYLNRGTAFSELPRPEAAVADYDKAIELRPDFADAYNNRGQALQELKQYEAAIASYSQALALNPRLRFLSGMRQYAKMQICDWDNFPADISDLTARIEGNETASPPLPVLMWSASAPLQRQAARIWMREQCPSDRSLPEIPRRNKHARIRLGYFSQDYGSHPVSILAAELFEMHDRSRFELTGFSLGPDTKDAMRLRLERAFDCFIDVRAKSDREVATLSRSMGIDIAVDLGGFTQGSRTAIFAMRAAPLQISYLGYLGTMGAEYIDYLLADATLVPVAQQPHYTEKILYLPSYQANDSTRRIAEKRFTREELRLPPAGFVYCCFNASCKITPSTFDGWMRILTRVPGSVLFLYAECGEVESNLRNEARRRGVDGARLVFGERLPAPEYLARYRAADLFLDTLPYNAGTTASDALWAGLPVLTCLGDTFAGRMAASLLKGIELPEMITATQECYEDLAVELALRPQRLAAIRQKLADNRLKTPLFDIRRFTKNIEAGYGKIYDRYHAGLQPEHTYVIPDED